MQQKEKNKEQRKEGNENWKKYIRKVLEKLNGLDLQINVSILSLKAAVMKMKAMLFST